MLPLLETPVNPCDFTVI